MRRMGLAILALSFTACSYTNADEDTRILYSGHFAYGFETSSFVPCEGGISHNEIENATPQDLAAGCNVLLHAALARAA